MYDGESDEEGLTFPYPILRGMTWSGPYLLGSPGTALLENKLPVAG